MLQHPISVRQRLNHALERIPKAFGIAQLFLVRSMKGSILALCFIALTRSSVPAAQYPEAEWKARFTSRPFPDYPAAYRKRHFTGNGVFRMHVDEQGRVTAITILKSTGHKELDVLAMKALVAWRGKPDPKWELDMPITFSMDMSPGSRYPGDAKRYPEEWGPHGAR
jgi:TonB family protein